MTLKAGVHNKGEISFIDVLSDMRQAPDFSKVGCILSFIGVVRKDVIDQDCVSHLVLEAWKAEADKALEAICKDEEQETGVIDVRIHHFLGAFNISEDLVYVLVAAAHRQEGFKSLRRAVERYKHEAPIWKKECLDSGIDYWVTEQSRPFGPSHPQSQISQEKKE